MRIHVNDLNPEMNLAISGSEEWLSRIYADFPLSPEEGVKPRAEGNLKLILEEGGTVLVRGKVRYAPVVNCGRCEKGIPFPLDLKIDMRFFPETLQDDSPEVNLATGDLDTYYLDKGFADIEGLINDTIQTAIPNRLVLTAEDGKACQICGIDLSEDRLFGAEAKEASPFAVLKDLKLR